jgi:hypothetical protein
MVVTRILSDEADPPLDPVLTDHTIASHPRGAVVHPVAGVLDEVAGERTTGIMMVV